mmetsp:Transcript_27549/g.53530  ORF Transcript_27549/g.53530 Transcript_27549/m.53530 type:complete len:307 (-) Transcript_27549:116-1036(-)
MTVRTTNDVESLACCSNHTHNILVGNLHTLGLSCGTGGVHHESKIIRLCRAQWCLGSLSFFKESRETDHFNTSLFAVVDSILRNLVLGVANNLEVIHDDDRFEALDFRGNFGECLEILCRHENDRSLSMIRDVFHGISSKRSVQTHSSKTLRVKTKRSQYPLESVNGEDPDVVPSLCTKLHETFTGDLGKFEGLVVLDPLVFTADRTVLDLRVHLVILLLVRILEASSTKATVFGEGLRPSLECLPDGCRAQAVIPDDAIHQPASCVRAASDGSFILSLRRYTDGQLVLLLQQLAIIVKWRCSRGS